MKLGLAEILSQAAKEENLVDKVGVLHLNDSIPLRKILKYILDPKIVWWAALKEPIKYTPNKYLDAEGRLFQEMRTIHMFVEGGDEDFANLTNDQKLTRLAMQNNPEKRMNKWHQLLESITPEDAQLLVAAPHRKFPFDGLDRSVIDAAFPGLIDPDGTPAPQIDVPVYEPPKPRPHNIKPQIAQPKILDINDILGN